VLQQYSPQKPEIMSPAGYWPQLRAAIEAGADSVYFGLKHFSARAKVGFSIEELPQVMRTLHARGVRGFVTFNTLVFEHELGEAARAIASIAEAGADALIVQDAGILRLVRRIAPELEIHASTQMSITDASGVELARSMGASRVTLARELSLADVRAIRSRTGCELEIFVHGALCVAYSGQCFSSEAWGGRSANRGQCAQACRLPYEMVVDGETKPLDDARYLLSPGDLYTLHHVPEMVDIGISALKIEGRYKDADYVAITTRAYRQAVDEAVAGRPLSISPLEELRIEQVYSRGLGPFFATGTNHQKVVEGRAARHRGVLMGRVIRISSDGIAIEPSDAAAISPLKPGDGVVFDAADWRSPQEPEEGGRVYEVRRLSEGIEVRFGNNVIRGGRIRVGDLVWRTHDPELDKAVRPLIEAAAPVRKQPVAVRLNAAEGEPLEMRWSLVAQPQVEITVTSNAPLGRAANRGLTADFARDQLARLGNTAYELDRIDVEIQGSPFTPASLLNQLRREAVEKLSARQTGGPMFTADDPSRVLEHAVAESRAIAEQHSQPARIHLLVRTPEQLDAAIHVRPATITLDYLDLYGLKPSVERVKSAGIVARVASPRVLKPGEERIVDFLLRLDCGILVRPAGLLESLRNREHGELTGDFSLNAANALSAAAFLKLGLRTITPGYDLNADQIAELARNVGGSRIEAIAYSHLPVFHTEHCVFCRFLSSGTTYKDCGRPCEKHRVEVRDPSGRAHPVVADVGCRNTVFGAEAQVAGAYLEAWMLAGIRDFRLEFVHESAAQVGRVAAAFSRVLAGTLDAHRLAHELRQIAPQGATQGSLFVPKDYLTLPVLQ
jgi:U32 family peptidase